MVLNMGEFVLMKGCCPFSFNKSQHNDANSFMSAKFVSDSNTRLQHNTNKRCEASFLSGKTPKWSSERYMIHTWFATLLHNLWYGLLSMTTEQSWQIGTIQHDGADFKSEIVMWKIKHNGPLMCKAIGSTKKESSETWTFLLAWEKMLQLSLIVAPAGAAFLAFWIFGDNRRIKTGLRRENHSSFFTPNKHSNIQLQKLTLNMSEYKTGTQMQNNRKCSPY